jgi:hypothetical protein
VRPSAWHQDAEHEDVLLELDNEPLELDDA